MDIIYENFLNTFHREKQGTENEIVKLLFIIKNENLLAAEKCCNSMLYIEESRLV